MNNFVSSMKIIGSLSIVVFTAVFAVVVVLALLSDGDKSIGSAQVVDVDEPPTNATEELDVKVDATEPLPVNGTIVVDISETHDIDIDAIPPEGVSIVVTNNTLTVTNNPVEITEGATGTQPDIGSLDTNTSDGSSGNDLESSGDDILIGGTGADYFDCGEGTDVVVDFDISENDDNAGNCEEIIGTETISIG
jgi:Ca2+-binding RTX toxin-like protein